MFIEIFQTFTEINEKLQNLMIFDEISQNITKFNYKTCYKLQYFDFILFCCISLTFAFIKPSKKIFMYDFSQFCILLKTHKMLGLIKKFITKNFVI
jgi:hypothetical protein